MDQTIIKTLDQLGYQPNFGAESESAITELERLVGVALPRTFRGFLGSVGGGELRDLVTPCSTATPFGQHNITRLHSAKQIIDFLDSEVTPRNMVCIGYGHFGMTTCLSVAGLDHGQVFSLDTEMRYYWDQATLDRFPALDESIKQFFHLRDTGQLPERPWGYENIYHLADSFEEFIQQLRPIAASGETDS